MELTQDLEHIESEPLEELWLPDAFFPSSETSVGKHRASVGQVCTLDSLSVNKQSSALLVSMYAATRRARIPLLRFERLCSFSRADDSKIHLISRRSLRPYARCIRHNPRRSRPLHRASNFGDTRGDGSSNARQ